MTEAKKLTLSCPKCGESPPRISWSTNRVPDAGASDSRGDVDVPIANCECPACGHRWTAVPTAGTLPEQYESA